MTKRNHQGNRTRLPGRREFLQLATCAGAFGTVGVGATFGILAGGKHPAVPCGAPRVRPFELDEITTEELQRGMTAGRFTAHSLAEEYLARIAEIDKRGPAVNAVIEPNPDALAIAAQLDRERRERGPRGPLHGIPVLIKDNIVTHDRMMTTAGSLALVGSVPRQDAFVVKRLRAAGALILGKTNLSEWADVRSYSSVSGWSGRGGLTLNPYALDRSPGGSSSGSAAAVAANLAAVALGSETDSSIVSPCSMNCLVGIKPTVGLISRAGVIPISRSQDTVGPMARTVADAAILLGVLAAVDPSDEVTQQSRGRAMQDYSQSLDPAGMKGARIGIARAHFGFGEKVDRILESAIDVLKSAGAVVIDPADILTLGQFEAAEQVVLRYELKAGLNAYLASLGPAAPVHSLAEIIAFNEQNRRREMPYFGQERFMQTESAGPLTTPEYLEALDLAHRLTRREGIDATMDKFQLDAIMAPTTGPAWVTDLVDGDHEGGRSTRPAAVAGYPNINVPAGYINGLPVGISFFGRAYSESALIKIAYGFEQATHHRRPPKFLPSADLTI